MSLIWFVLMVLFIILWRQAEKKAEQNFEAYEELRRKLLRLNDGRKSISTKELVKNIDQVEVQTQYVAEPPVQQTNDNSITDNYNVDPVTEEASSTDIKEYESTYKQAAAEVVEQSETLYVEQQLSPEELAERKERATLRNLNIVLYMASFLLVAAAAAFVAAAMPEIVRLMGLLIVILLFYVAGIILYVREPRFKPAAVAFVGTGLAILPFAGVALTLLGGVGASTAWFLTSAVGLVAYVFAGAVLKSQVVSYLSMAFVLSLASSAVSAASLPTVWYFIALIGVSLIASTISHFKPDALPSVFKKPIETTGQIVTPIALVASIFVARSMSIEMYEVLFGVSTAHYLVVWLQRRQLFYETIVRLLAQFTLLIEAWDVMNMPFEGDAQFGLWWVILLIAQVAYSLVSVRRSDSKERLVVEQVWVVVAHVGLVLALGFWTSSHAQALLVTLNLLLLGIVAFISGVVMRQAGWGYVSLVASLVVPFVFGRWAAEPQWSFTMLIFTFAVLALASLAVYWRLRDKDLPAIKRLLAISVVCYVLALALSGILDGHVVVHGWSMVLAGVLLVGFSYALRTATVELVGATIAAYGFGVVAATLVSDGSWKVYVGFVAATLVLAGGAVVHQLVDKSHERRDGLTVIALIVFASFALLSPRLSDIVHILTFILTLAILVSLIGLRWLAGRDEPSALRSIFIVGYIGYLVLGWTVSFHLADGWQALYFGVATVVIWLASRLERRPAVVLVGNGALVVCLSMLWQWLQFAQEWQSICVGILASGILYGAYIFYIMFHDAQRQWLMLVSAWTVLVGGVYLSSADGPGSQLLSVVALVCSVAMLCLHHYIGHDTKKNYGKLSTFVSVAAAVYFCGGFVYAFRDAQLAAWTYSIAAITTAWLSYRANSRHIEGFAAIEVVGAVWFFASLIHLGDWQTTFFVALSVAILVAGVFLHHFRGEVERRNTLLRITVFVYGLLVTNWYLAEAGIAQSSFIAILTAALASLTVRWILQRRASGEEIRSIAVIAYVLYVLLALAIGANLGAGWLTGALLAAAIIFWVSSHIEDVPSVVVLAHMFVFGAVLSAWHWLGLPVEWMLPSSAGLSAAIYYGSYWVYLVSGSAWRASASLVATVTVLGISTVFGSIGYGDQAHAIATNVSLVAAAVITGVHGLIKKRWAFVEVSVYVATYGLQSILGILQPDINAVWYAHWWAFVIALMAWWRDSHKTLRFAVAMACITATVGVSALAEGGVYQLLFLVEHVLLLVAGALLRKQWAVWWGIAASVGAILYFIKEYTYLWLGLLGLALIALVVWRLSKLGKTQKK